jgi:hypothetical protein
MKSLNCLTSSCRHCRYYVPEGRRGGHCRQLNVAVQSAWKACTLALPPFAPAWESLEGIMAWQQKALSLASGGLQEGATDKFAVNGFGIDPLEVERMSALVEPVSVSGDK